MENVNGRKMSGVCLENYLITANSNYASQGRNRKERVNYWLFFNKSRNLKEISLCLSEKEVLL